MKTIEVKTNKVKVESIRDLEPGDTFVYISKYGSETLGVVSEIFRLTSYREKFDFVSYNIVSTTGNTYALNEVFKVTRQLTEEEQVERRIQLEKAADVRKRLSDHKSFAEWKANQIALKVAEGELKK